MVLRVNTIVQTYGVPEMRTFVSGKQAIFVSAFSRQMKDDGALWLKLVLCPERFGKLIPNLRPKTKLWVSGTMLLDSYVTKEGESRMVKRIFVEGVEVVSWGRDIDREEQESQAQEPEPEPSEESDPELFPF